MKGVRFVLIIALAVALGILVYQCERLVWSAEAQGPGGGQVFLPLVMNGFIYVQDQAGEEVLPDPDGDELYYAVRRGSEFTIWTPQAPQALGPTGEPLSRFYVWRPVAAWGWRNRRIEVVFDGDEGTRFAWALAFDPATGRHVLAWCLSKTCGIIPTPTPEKPVATATATPIPP